MPQLTAVKAKFVTKPGKYGDGAGLHLNVAVVAGTLPFRHHTD